MGDGPPNMFVRNARKAYKSLMGGDVNLPISGATPEAQRRKKQQDQQQGQAMRTLGSLARGKSPIKK